MVLFDVGAHFGYYSVIGASLVGASGSVVAFEPTPRTRTVLQANAKGRPNVKVEPLAVYSAETEVMLRDFGPLTGGFNTIMGGARDSSLSTVAASVFRVNATSLDRYIEATGISPDFVKIDAESSEFDILTGMSEVLTRDQPYVTFEGGDLDVLGARPTSDLIDMIESVGYRTYEIGTVGCIRLPRLSRYGYLNVLAVPPRREAPIGG
jgi:FkbM family methyltransferase